MCVCVRTCVSQRERAGCASQKGLQAEASPPARVRFDVNFGQVGPGAAAELKKRVLSHSKATKNNQGTCSPKAH